MWKGILCKLCKNKFWLKFLRFFSCILWDFNCGVVVFRIVYIRKWLLMLVFIMFDENIFFELFVKIKLSKVDDVLFIWVGIDKNVILCIFWIYVFFLYKYFDVLYEYMLVVRM